MKAVKDWISCQVASSKSLLSARPLSGDFIYGESVVEGSEDQGSTLGSGLRENASPGTSNFYVDTQVQESCPLLPQDCHQSNSVSKYEKDDPLCKVEALQINYLRLIHRLDQSPQNPVVAQVLYRLQLACLIRAEACDGRRVSLKNDKAIAIAAELEGVNHSDLNFSLKILLLGKTGVGKSSTINSILDQEKAATDAFQPATDHVQEVLGSINGIKITLIDTPGLLSSCAYQRQNRKILLSVKRFIKRSKPDMVLYFERLDSINTGYSDFPLLKLVTDILGPAIWFNALLVMTHSASALPETSDGYPVSYGGYVAQCTRVVQHYIQQAANDRRVENPVLLVENHPLCKTNNRGEKILPNGQVWKSHFLLLCVSSKVLFDANGLLRFQDSFPLRQAGSRTPSLPHLLTSLLQPHSYSSSEDLDEVSDLDEEDEYDQLPPFRFLKKSEFERLNKDLKKDYLDEMEYRETLYLKKQWKGELRRKRDILFSKDKASTNDANFETDSSQAVPLQDMAIPLSFSSDNPVYRYRCLANHNDQWHVGPVLDSQGWDHDIGFDGINLEVSEDFGKDLHASIVGQMSKDKHDFNLQAESAASFADLLRGSLLSAGLGVQTSGGNLVCTTRGGAKLRTWKNNATGCEVSLTSVGDKYVVGAKLEDSLVVARRLKFLLNMGRVAGCGQVAYGGSLEATLKGRDHPVRNDKTSVVISAVSFDKDTVLGGSIQSEFRPCRGTKLSANVSLNSRKMGQVCLKTSSSEHIELCLFVIVPILRALFRRRGSRTLLSPVEEEKTQVGN
ncbi:translocase of chloroplast 90, chloroplastic [Aristolochia californica]|uniref:translocase of chloroplast 90, chloroplastic n=1 Tax=Aristolochia californica TaxID=171875 RepID=UPI0035E397AA